MISSGKLVAATNVAPMQTWSTRGVRILALTFCGEKRAEREWAADLFEHHHEHQRAWCVRFRPYPWTFVCVSCSLFFRNDRQPVCVPHPL